MNDQKPTSRAALAEMQTTWTTAQQEVREKEHLNTSHLEAPIKTKYRERYNQRDPDTSKVQHTTATPQKVEHDEQSEGTTDEDTKAFDMMIVSRWEKCGIGISRRRRAWSS